MVPAIRGGLHFSRVREQLEVLAAGLVIFVILDEELLIESADSTALFGSCRTASSIRKSGSTFWTTTPSTTSLKSSSNSGRRRRSRRASVRAVCRRTSGQAVRLVPDDDRARFERDLVLLHELNDEWRRFRLLGSSTLTRPWGSTELMSSTARVQGSLAAVSRVDLDATGLVDARVGQAESETPDPRRVVEVGATAPRQGVAGHLRPASQVRRRGMRQRIRRPCLVLAAVFLAGRLKMIHTFLAPASKALSMISRGAGGIFIAALSLRLDSLRPSKSGNSYSSGRSARAASCALNFGK